MGIPIDRHFTTHPTYPTSFMKIQLASDLHLEFFARILPQERLIQAAPDADVLVLAGDIHNGTQALDLFKNWPVPVLYVAGNHEFYGHQWDQIRDDLRTQCEGTAIRFLDNSRVDFGEVRFLGATLWTDFSLSGVGMQGIDVGKAMRCARDSMADFSVIQTQVGLFTPEQAMQDHAQSVRWLAQQMQLPFDGTTVVITHHAPHPLSIHPRYHGDWLNAAFASDLTPLMPKIDCWLHGHVHDSFDYRVGRCRVVANPAGYIENRSALPWLSNPKFENEHFDAGCVIDLADSGASL